jgi:hypothetical protein
MVRLLDMSVGFVRMMYLLCSPGRLVGCATYFACCCGCCCEVLLVFCLLLDNELFKEPKMLLREESIVEVRRCGPKVRGSVRVDMSRLFADIIWFF